MSIVSIGNRTEWSPIWSVIIRVITNRTTAQRKSDLFITSMIGKVSDKKFCDLA